MSQENKTISKIEEELTIEEYTVVIGEIPFVVSLGEGAEYSGPPNKQLAFAVSEELGLEGAGALMRFASLCMQFAKLGGEQVSPPHDARHSLSPLASPHDASSAPAKGKSKGKSKTKQVTDDQPLTALLNEALEVREAAKEEQEKEQEKERDQADVTEVK